MTSGENLHNIFQPILQVDHQMNAKVNAYEMLMRNSAGTFPGLDFLQSLATAAGNQVWITVSRRSLADFLTGHPERRVYINIEPCQLTFDQTWQFLSEIHDQYGQQVAIEITERRAEVHDIDYLDQEIQRMKSLGFEFSVFRPS